MDFIVLSGARTRSPPLDAPDGPQPPGAHLAKDAHGVGDGCGRRAGEGTSTFSTLCPIFANCFASLYNSSFLATTTRRPSLAPSWTIRTTRTTTLEDECPPPQKKVLPRNQPGHRRPHEVRRLIDVTNSNLYRQDPFSASNRCVHPR